MGISLAPETLFSLGPIQITNTLFTALIIFILIVLVFGIVSSNLKYREPGKFQIALEMLISGLLGLATDILGEKKGKNLFGFLFTFFIFIFISNWFGLLPFVPTTVIGKEEDHSILNFEAALIPTVQAKSNEAISIDTQALEKDNISIGDCINQKDCYLTASGIQKFSEEKHLFRAPTSDLSLTIAFALISVIITNILGFKALGATYLKKYINFSNPVDAFVGILELISEIGKIISFSFRLFGNVFAGEILLAVITSITYGVATLPFLGLELFVGLIQALVFFMLTAVFIGLSAESHSEVDATDAVHAH